MDYEDFFMTLFQVCLFPVSLGIGFLVSFLLDKLDDYYFCKELEKLNKRKEISLDKD